MSFILQHVRLSWLVGFCALVGLSSGSLLAQDRPMHGSLSGSIVNQIPPNGLEAYGVGEATHLGKYARTEQVFLNADGSFVAYIVFYAANGDQLWADADGQFISPTTAVGDYQFVGGTGRFSDATGHADFQAVTPDGVLVFVEFSGQINY